MRTALCGKNWIHLEKTDSTNRFLLDGDFPEGTVATADLQTKGRGRQGKSWVCAPCGQALYLSVIFRSFNAGDFGFLPLICAVAAAKAYGGTMIKWPNDILVNEKKVGGILCESKILGGSAVAVCGIGLNLSQPQEFFADNNLPWAASLFSCGKDLLTPKHAAVLFLNELEPCITTYRLSGFGSFLPFYRDRCVTLGRKVVLERCGRAVTATACDIGEKGELVCESGGETFFVTAGEVSVRGLYGYA